MIFTCFACFAVPHPAHDACRLCRARGGNAAIYGYFEAKELAIA
jgi:hypothetical protein